MEDALVVPEGTGAFDCAVVIFGAGGDLMARKLGPGFVKDLDSLPKAERRRYKFIGADLIPMDKYEEFLEDRFEDHSPGTLKLEAWQDFSSSLEYHHVGRGMEEARALFSCVAQFLRHNPKATVQFYLAVPHTANIKILEQAVHYLGGTGVGSRIFFVSEKPLEISAASLERIKHLLELLGVPEGNFGVTEHFDKKPFFEHALNTESSLAKLMGRIVQRKWRKVIFTVKEKIGTEKRAYYGIGIDSMLNHHAYMMAVVFGFLFTVSSIVGKRKGFRLSQVLCDVAKRIVAPWGQYLCCRQDHCPPQHVPTGIHLRYDVKLDNGELLEVESSHVKNTDEKVTKARIEGDNWVLELLMDGFRKGVRGYGWRLWENGTIAEEHFEALPPEKACGYPEVVRAVRLRRMDEFMPLDFQQCSNGLFMGLLERLDKIPVGERMWFDIGDAVLERITPETLRPLHQEVEAVA